MLASIVRLPLALFAACALVVCAVPPADLTWSTTSRPGPARFDLCDMRTVSDDLPTSDFAFSSDGTLLAYGTADVSIFDVLAGTTRKIPDVTDFPAAFAPNGHLLACQ